MAVTGPPLPEGEGGVAEALPDDERSPPPSMYSTVVRPPSRTATAAGVLGPSSRGTVHDVVPLTMSIAVTSWRSTMIASPPAITGAGSPEMWVSSPIPVAVCHTSRNGGAGETDTKPPC